MTAADASKYAPAGGVPAAGVHTHSQCKEDDLTLASEAAFGAKDLAEHGITESTDQVQTEALASIPSDGTTYDCKQFIAALLVIAENGSG